MIYARGRTPGNGTVSAWALEGDDLGDAAEGSDSDEPDVRDLHGVGVVGVLAPETTLIVGQGEVRAPLPADQRMSVLLHVFLLFRGQLELLLGLSPGRDGLVTKVRDGESRMVRPEEDPRQPLVPPPHHIPEEELFPELSQWAERDLGAGGELMPTVLENLARPGNGQPYHGRVVQGQVGQRRLEACPVRILGDEPLHLCLGGWVRADDKAVRSTV